MVLVPAVPPSLAARCRHAGTVAATLAFLICGSLATASAVDQLPTPPETVHLTTLNWPPYTSAGPQPGEVQKTVKAAFTATGMTLSTGVLPWRRAIRVGLHEPGYDGYFPEYASAQLTGLCLLSDPIGSGPLGLVYRADTPLAWSTLADLKSARLGVVQDYLNTDQVDAMLRLGDLHAETAIDDVTNLRKVLARRIDAAVIDLAVYRFLMQSQTDLRPYADLLVADPQVLETKTLHVCFRPTAEGARLRDRFNAGLAKAQATPQAQPIR